MNVSERITSYLSNGGLFNPEMMEHEKVRDLLIEARESIERLERQLKRADDLAESVKRLFIYFSAPHLDHVSATDCGTDLSRTLDDFLVNPQPCYRCGEPDDKRCACEPQTL